MKKGISIFILLLLIVSGAFAQFQMSVGGGLFFDSNVGGGVDWEHISDKEVKQIFIVSSGVYGFFDLSYVEIDVNFAYGKLYDDTDLGHELHLGLSLLGKYPFKLGMVTLFPLIGVSYNLVLSWTDNSGKPFYKEIYENSFEKPWDLSQFGLLFGGGLDFNLPGSLYLRGEALFHLHFPAKIWDGYIDFIKETIEVIKTDTTLGYGPRIKIGVGYRL